MNNKNIFYKISYSFIARTFLGSLEKNLKINHYLVYVNHELVCGWRYSGLYLVIKPINRINNIYCYNKK